jgi:hypothetical protein
VLAHLQADELHLISKHASRRMRDLLSLPDTFRRIYDQKQRGRGDALEAARMRDLVEWTVGKEKDLGDINYWQVWMAAHVAALVEVYLVLGEDGDTVLHLLSRLPEYVNIDITRPAGASIVEDKVLIRGAILACTGKHIFVETERMEEIMFTVPRDAYTIPTHFLAARSAMGRRPQPVYYDENVRMRFVYYVLRKRRDAFIRNIRSFNAPARPFDGKVKLIRSCAHCDAPEATQQCGNLCGSAAYCGQACADAHWGEHVGACALAKK